MMLMRKVFTLLLLPYIAIFSKPPFSLQKMPASPYLREEPDPDLIRTGNLLIPRRNGIPTFLPNAEVMTIPPVVIIQIIPSITPTMSQCTWVPQMVEVEEAPYIALRMDGPAMCLVPTIGQLNAHIRRRTDLTTSQVTAPVPAGNLAIV